MSRMSSNLSRLSGPVDVALLIYSPPEIITLTVSGTAQFVNSPPATLEGAPTTRPIRWRSRASRASEALPMAGKYVRDAGQTRAFKERAMSLDTLSPN